MSTNPNTCQASWNESGSQCGHTHHCILHEDHDYSFINDSKHKCACGKEWL